MFRRRGGRLRLCGGSAGRGGRWGGRIVLLVGVSGGSAGGGVAFGGVGRLQWTLLLSHTLFPHKYYSKRVHTGDVIFGAVFKEDFGGAGCGDVGCAVWVHLDPVLRGGLFVVSGAGAGGGGGAGGWSGRCGGGFEVLAEGVDEFSVGLFERGFADYRGAGGHDVAGGEDAFCYHFCGLKGVWRGRFGCVWGGFLFMF